MKTGWEKKGTQLSERGLRSELRPLFCSGGVCRTDQPIDI